MTGIAAANRSHLKFFPDMDAYGVYYDLLVELSRIAVANFAERCQSLLMAFLRAEYGDATTDWYSTRQFIPASLKAAASARRPSSQSPVAAPLAAAPARPARLGSPPRLAARLIPAFLKARRRPRQGS